MTAALRYAVSLPKDSVVVTILCDRAERYFSTRLFQASQLSIRKKYLLSDIELQLPALIAPRAHAPKFEYPQFSNPALKSNGNNLLTLAR